MKWENALLPDEAIIGKEELGNFYCLPIECKLNMNPLYTMVSQECIPNINPLYTMVSHKTTGSLLHYHH